MVPDSVLTYLQIILALLNLFLFFSKAWKNRVEVKTKHLHGYRKDWRLVARLVRPDCLVFETLARIPIKSFLL